jgi:uncharacterized phage protein (TIGR01671 family)
MRELKFKFWNKLAHRFQAPNKYAIQGDGLYVSYDYDMMAWDDPSSFDDIILVPCQYTGLKDKNGKEIYEGDYIKNSDGLIMSVKWNQSRCCFAASVSTADGWMNLLEDLIKDFEVIGNIFENNDLLKQ